MRVGGWFAAAGLAGCAGSVDADVPEAGVDARVQGVDRPPAADRPPRVDAAEEGVDPAVSCPVEFTGGDPHVRVVEIATGSQLHTCARMEDGTVRCRGLNDVGALGVPGTERCERAVEVPGVTEVEQVVTGGIFGMTCTRHRDGRVRCWGDNYNGMLGTGGVGDEACPILEGRACRTRATLVPDLDGVVYLAASWDAVCAVRQDGSLWCWGTFLPDLGAHSTRPRRMVGLDEVVWVRSVSSSPYWLVRHRDGSLRYTGPLGPSIDPVLFPGEFGPSYASGHLCVTLPDATVRCAGNNHFGQLGDGTTHSALPSEFRARDTGLTAVRAVATGAYHTCAVRLDGTAWCWGDATHGALGTRATGVCEGIQGGVLCAPRPVKVDGIDRVTALFLGVWSTWALRDDGSVWYWGTARTPAPRPTRVEW